MSKPIKILLKESIVDCKIKLLMLIGILLSNSTISFAQLSIYNNLPNNRLKCQVYSLKVGEARADGSLVGALNDVYTLQYLRTDGTGVNNQEALSDNHWLTFSFGAHNDATQASVEVSKLVGSITSVEFRPTTSVNSFAISGGKLTFTMNSDKMVAVIINNDIKQPLFVFCDPVETNVPSINSPDVYVVSGTTKENPLRISNIPSDKKIVYFGPGLHYAYSSTDPASSNGAGLVITNNSGSRVNSNQINQVYIAGGALVVGAIRAPKVTNLTVNGRGIIATQFEGIPYCEQGNKYLEDRIYNSSIVMADYNSVTNRNQMVDGITIILPLKYCIQVGAYATVRNCKAFAYHQTTDGVGAEKSAKIYNNFFKVNDDVVKIYNDSMEVRNTMIWHQNNGACFQLGWNESQGKNCVIKHTFLLRDDAADSYMNDSHWDNHSFINWHSTGYTNNKPIHDGHIFDSINAEGMPLVKVWRFMAINLNGRYPGGTLGGYLRNLQVKNVNLGTEKLASYIGATINGSTAEVNFTNAKLNGVCLNKTNIVQDGQVTVTPTVNVCVAPTTPPIAPSNLIATNVTYKTISLSWTDNSDIEDNFVLERSINGIDGWTLLASPTDHIFIDNNLQAQTPYFYRVKAINSIGSSAYTSLQTATIAPPSVVPITPSNCIATAESDKVISLRWIDNAADEDEYVIQQLSGSNWNTIKTLSVNTTSVTVNGLTQKTEYSFRVIAVNIVGNSLPSNTATATTKEGFDSGIVSNGSFEEGVNINDDGTWVLQSNNVSQSTEKAKSGTFSAKFQNPSGNYIEPEFNFKPLFSCYGAGSYNVTISVYVPASNNGKVELYFTPQNIYFQPGATNVDKWVTITQKVTYNAGSEIKLKAKTYNGPTGAMFYVDDISITTNNPKCTTSSQFEKIESLKVYPNPASNVVYVQSIGTEKIAKIEIISANGKIEKQVFSNSNFAKIDISSLTRGIKIIEICDEKGLRTHRKLLVK